MKNLELEDRFDEDVFDSLVESLDKKSIFSFLEEGKSLRKYAVDGLVSKKVKMVEDYLGIDIEEIYREFHGFDRLTIGLVFNHFYDSLVKRNGFKE